jgi:hypothetical protein
MNSINPNPYTLNLKLQKTIYPEPCTLNPTSYSVNFKHDKTMETTELFVFPLFGKNLEAHCFDCFVGASVRK